MRKANPKAVKKLIEKIMGIGTYNFCIDHKICPKCGGHLFDHRWNLFHCNDCDEDVWKEREG